MDVDHVGGGDQRPRPHPGLHRLQGLRDPRHPQPPRAPAHVRDAGAADRRPEGEEPDAMAALRETLAEQVGEERVGGLVRGQVRRDHEHVHAARSQSRANSA
jgi:hypothetical protein